MNLVINEMMTQNEAPVPELARALGKERALREAQEHLQGYSNYVIM